MNTSASTYQMRDTLRDFTADRRMLMLCAMALVTGTFGAMAAWALVKLIALCTNFAYFHIISTTTTYLTHARLGPSSIFVPVIGGIIVGLIARYGSEKIRGHGIPEALDAILTGGSRIEPKVAFWKPLASAIAIGTGGPFGAEGPIIMTGGALGSLFGQCFRLSSAERKTLLAAGAAAGMTGIFGTPVAAVLLAIEVLLFEWKPRSFVPVTVSVIVAMAWRPWLVGPWPLFPHSGLPSMPWWSLALCAGVGYDTIDALINGTVLLHAAIALLCVKSIIWLASLSSGTAGGTLAPLLLMGGAVGAIEAHVLPCGNCGFWALISMAAVLGGTLRCPLTATLFAVELTGDLRVMPAVTIACAASFAVSVLLMRRSILTERLARRGRHLTYEYNVDPYEVMRVREIMAHPVHSLPASMSREDALAFFDAKTDLIPHQKYPVVDDLGHLSGVVSCSEVLRWSREAACGEQTLGEHVVIREVLVGYPDEPVGALADRMTAASTGCAPIVDRATGALLGLVARRDLLQVRAHVAKLEQERAAPLGMRTNCR